MLKRRSITKLFQDQSGATLVEAAFVLPIYFMLIFGIFGWGLVLWQINALQYAAEKAVRCSILPYNLQGNRQCGDFSNPQTNLISWIPMITAASFSPNASSGTTPTVARSFQSSRTGTAEGYSVNCVTISVANPFYIRIADMPATLIQNYCRTIQK